MEIGEADERQIGQPLDAEVARPPLRMKLAAEAVQPLELEDAVGREQAAPNDASRHRHRAVRRDEIRQSAEVERELGRALLLRPRERLDAEELDQAVRRLG